jgi:hypothetical protein
MTLLGLKRLKLAAPSIHPEAIISKMALFFTFVVQEIMSLRGPPRDNGYMNKFAMIR